MLQMFPPYSGFSLKCLCRTNVVLRDTAPAYLSQTSSHTIRPSFAVFQPLWPTCDSRSKLTFFPPRLSFWTCYSLCLECSFLLLSNQTISAHRLSLTTLTKINTPSSLYWSDCLFPSQHVLQLRYYWLSSLEQKFLEARQDLPCSLSYLHGYHSAWHMAENSIIICWIKTKFLNLPF